MAHGGRKCICCTKTVERRWPARQCNACYIDSHKIYGMTFGSRIARAAVTTAIASGVLHPVKGRLCADCGQPATEYDHRDYNKPLDVQPVCHGCNMRRGKAIPLDIAGYFATEAGANATAKAA